MIKTALVYFITDFCLDKIDETISFNMMPPEKRKSILEQWKALIESHVLKLRGKSLSAVVIDEYPSFNKSPRYAEVSNILGEEKFYSTVKFSTIGSKCSQ